MSDRPKIKITKKKGESPQSPEPEKQKVEEYSNHNQQQPTEEISQDKEENDIPELVHDGTSDTSMTADYDEFAKPIPWSKIILIFFTSAVVLAAVYFFILPLFTGSNDDLKSENMIAEIQNADVVDKNGFYIKEMLPKGSEKIEDILSKNMSLRDLLNQVNVASSDVNALESQGNKYSIKRLRAGDKYTLAHTPGSENEVQMLMIEPKAEPYSFYKIDVANTLTIEKMDKQVEIRESYIAAIVEGTLGQTFIDNNLNLKLISSIEEVLAWTIDLFEVGDGDRFKVLYDEEFVNGKSYRIDKIKALYFETKGKPFYAYNYNSGQQGFYDEYGRSMKRSFLATPIKYGGVITSGYGLRVHPITGHEKAHLGTDFAAPEGTPIQAVADGTISIAQFKANNGYYVKIRHDKTYETQYLHMQKFANGIRAGSKVRQGDIIGFVGSTGLSSGPHVCYRFWKNKEQVDYAQENASSGSRIPTKSRSLYDEHIVPLNKKIKEINYF